MNNVNVRIKYRTGKYTPIDKNVEEVVSCSESQAIHDLVSKFLYFNPNYKIEIIESEIIKNKTRFSLEEWRKDMTYLELARKIKSAYKELKQDELYKFYNVIWNNVLGELEITVENDAGFRAIIIGNTCGVKKSRGYMYLFYTNDDTESFPTVKEIEHRLKVVANQEILTDKNADYFDWEQYGSLEAQRKYFSEIILNAIKR